MPSQTGGHDFEYKKADGSVVKVANTAVRGWRTDTNADLGLVGTTDSNGVLTSQTVNVPAGTVIILTPDRYQGVSESLYVTTVS